MIEIYRAALFLLIHARVPCPKYGLTKSEWFNCLSEYTRCLHSKWSPSAAQETGKSRRYESFSASGRAADKERNAVTLMKAAPTFKIKSRWWQRCVAFLLINLCSPSIITSDKNSKQHQLSTFFHHCWKKPMGYLSRLRVQRKRHIFWITSFETYKYEHSWCLRCVTRA